MDRGLPACWALWTMLYFETEANSTRVSSMISRRQRCSEQVSERPGRSDESAVERFRWQKIPILSGKWVVSRRVEAHKRATTMKRLSCRVQGPWCAWIIHATRSETSMLSTRSIMVLASITILRLTTACHLVGEAGQEDTKPVASISVCSPKEDGRMVISTCKLPITSGKGTIRATTACFTWLEDLATIENKYLDVMKCFRFDVDCVGQQIEVLTGQNGRTNKYV